MTVLLGTLWSSIKQIKAPYMFDWEMQLLCMQCRGIGPHLAATGSLIVFFELRQEPGVYCRVTAGMSIRNWSLLSEVRTPVCV